MNQLQVVKASIHQNSQIVLSLGDFNKNQQVLELLKNFLLDYKNKEIFRSIILEDVNPQTIFVLYSLLQTVIKNGDHFYNFPNLDGINNEQYFYNEFENRVNITNLCTFHVDVALTYLKRQLDHPTYVYNQVIFTIALLLRKYWIEINRIEELIFQIIQSTKFQYQQIFFNLFDNLVSCIRQYQYANGYIEFRKTMSSFSASSLQRIIEATLIEIQKLGQCSILQIYQNNKTYATSFIGLLYQILNVNFNLSYYEIDFDSENRGDTSQLTNFPDYYFDLITNTNFLKEMFCSTISFLKIDQNLSLQCINILQRIACIRLSIFHKKKCKGAFRKQLWEGLLYLYQNQDQFIIYPDFSYEIHSLSIRIINNLTLRKLHKFSDLFEQCFLLLSNVYTKTIQIYGMKVITNNPCTKIQELWNQIGYQVSLHRNQTDDLNQRVNQVMQNHLTIVLNAFFSQISFSEVPQDLSPKKFKKMIALLFLPYQYLFKLKLLDNLQSLMMMIQQLKMNYCEYKCAALICLAQSFLLYIQASDNFNFGFDSYQFPQKEDRPNTDLKASVLKYVIEVIINPQIPKTTKILQMASLNFIESFTNATLDSLCYDKDQKILKNLSQLYGELIRIDLNYQNYLFILEKILEECFQVFTCTDPTLIEYSLKLIEFIYSKVKRLLPRNVFRSCGITSMLKQFFLQLNITCLDNPRYIKKRALIFKIVAIVWIDDCSDEYVTSIVEIYSQIKKNIVNEMNKESMLKYIWDLIGIASEIDNDQIYRTFLRVIYPDISKILTPENIQIFVKDYDSSIAILTLLRAIFYNKNTRIQTENILLILYQIYGSAINFFIILMKMQIQEAKTTQKLSDNQIKQVHKLMAVMSQISNSKIFNQGFFIIYNDLTLLELFKQQIQLIYIYRPQLVHIPKYKKELYELLDNICQEHPETLAYKCDATTYIEIFSICKESLSEVIKDNQGDDSINENCSTLIQIGSLLSNIATFLIQEASVGHQNDTIMIQNKIQQIIQQGKNNLFEIFSLSCQISSIYPKNSKIIYIIPEILYGISIFCPLEFEQLLVQIISNQVGINQNFTDLISLAFKNLQCELKISGKEDFIKKLKQILEAYK